MGSKSLFRNQNIDSHIYNQSSNFEDACSYDDFSGCLNTSTKYLKKVPTWPVFPQDNNANASLNGTPNATPQSSPPISRKVMHNDYTNSDLQSKDKRWFNAQLFVPFGANGISKHNATDAGSFMRKSNSYKNVSNFDINAIGPISF